MSILREVDNLVLAGGYTRRMSAYLLGGSALSVAGTKHSTKDVDMFVTRQDFRVLSSVIPDVEKRHGIRIDLFPEGEMVDFFYKDYAVFCEPVHMRLSRLRVYRIDDVGLILLKGIADRTADWHDLLTHFSQVELPVRSALEERFSRLQIKRGKEGELIGKFQQILFTLYDGQGYS